MEKIQKICVGAFIHRDGNILILRRSKKETFLPGYWDIPGGKMNFGESTEEALRRECKEEINVDIGRTFIPCSTFSYVSDNGHRHNVDIQFLIPAPEKMDNIKLIDHDEYKWIGENELGSHFGISEEMGRALKKGFEMIKILKL
jgi:8-oxo-dGTP diphosphatase